jgi:hypothetical protein
VDVPLTPTQSSHPVPSQVRAPAPPPVHRVEDVSPKSYMLDFRGALSHENMLADFIGGAEIRAPAFPEMTINCSFRSPWDGSAEKNLTSNCTEGMRGAHTRSRCLREPVAVPLAC